MTHPSSSLHSTGGVLAHLLSTLHEEEGEEAQAPPPTPLQPPAPLVVEEGLRAGEEEEGGELGEGGLDALTGRLMATPEWAQVC